MPAGSAGEASTDQLEPEAGVPSVSSGEPVVSVPAYTSTVTVEESPGAVPAAPANVGVTSFVTSPSAGSESVTAGSAVLMLHVLLAGEGSTFPAWSIARASNVWEPEARPL